MLYGLIFVKYLHNIDSNFQILLFLEDLIYHILKIIYLNLLLDVLSLQVNLKFPERYQV